MSYWDSIKRFADDIKRYKAGEINEAELAIRLAGEGGTQVGEGISTLADFFTPDVIQEWAAEEVRAPMEALGEIGKDIGSAAYDASSEGVRDFLTSERVQRNVGSGLNALNLVGMKAIGSPGQWHKLANNMPNELPLFYKGLPQYESARATKEGIKNRLNELVSPRSQAMQREGQVPAFTQQVVRQANEDAGKMATPVAELKAELEAKAGKKLTEEQLKKDPTYKALAKKYKQRVKAGIGQVGQNALIDRQYGKPDANKLVKEAADEFTLSSGGFTKERVRELFPELTPEAADTIYRAISQTQGNKRFPLLPESKLNPRVPVTSGFLNERKMVGQAADDIGRGARRQAVTPEPSLFDFAKAGFKPENLVKEKPTQYYKDIKQAYVDRPIANMPSSFDDLRSRMTAGKPLKPKLKAYLDRADVQDGFNKAMKDPAYAQVQTQQDMIDVLSKYVPGTPSNIQDITKRTFGNTPTKTFKNNAELIESLEAQGVPIFNKARVKEGEPVIVTDAFKSGAMDLGGMGRIYAMFPDGRRYVIAHDKNDLIDSTPYGAEPGLTVAAFGENLSTGQRGLHKETQREAPKLKPEDYEGTNFTPNASRKQKAVLKNIMDYEPDIKMIDRLRALRNAGLMGGMMFEDEYEEYY